VPVFPPQQGPYRDVPVPEGQQKLRLPPGFGVPSETKFPRDNGSAFINNATEIWCEKENLHFTRSRDHKKNDNCFVEQKNGALVRGYAGYDRLEGREEQALLAAVSKPLVPLFNFFIPSQKLSSKTRVGSKEIKVYDDPKILFQRLTENTALPQKHKDMLNARCVLYNPVELL
jgi:hypothetical protein